MDGAADASNDGAKCLFDFTHARLCGANRAVALLAAYIHIYTYNTPANMRVLCDTVRRPNPPPTAVTPPDAENIPYSTNRALFP